MGRDVTRGEVDELRRQAAGWKARGHAHEAEATPASLTEALRCYREGETLLRALSLRTEAVRLEQGILLMNRGNALQRLGSPSALAEAVQAYDEALALLPAGNGVARNALGAAWLNRGRALQTLGGPAHLAEALRSQEQAVALLRPWADDEDRHFALNLAGACLNLATLLAGAGRLAEAGEAIDEGLALARRKGNALRPVALHLFHFGAQLCAIHQPQFLAEFVRENLDPADEASLAAAREAVRRAQAELRRPRLLQADDPAALRLLATWQELGGLSLG
jgi:tetratricopeptide (TPR) repeat protein